MLAWSCYWRMLDNWRIHERGHSRQGARTQSAVSFACLFGCLVFSHACSHLVEPRLTISLPWVRRGFTTKLQHKRMAEKSRYSAPARNAAKMRVCRSQAFSAPLSVWNGIEKVRGSTPLISTLQMCANRRVSACFLSMWMPARGGGARCFTTLYNTRAGLPAMAESVCTYENQADGVGVRQSRPMVLCGSTTRRKTSAASPAPRSRRKAYLAGGSSAQDGRGRRRAVLGRKHAASRTA